MPALAPRLVESTAGKAGAGVGITAAVLAALILLIAGVRRLVGAASVPAIPYPSFVPPADRPTTIIMTSSGQAITVPAPSGIVRSESEQFRTGADAARAEVLRRAERHSYRRSVQPPTRGRRGRRRDPEAGVAHPPPPYVSEADEDTEWTVLTVCQPSQSCTSSDSDHSDAVSTMSPEQAHIPLPASPSTTSFAPSASSSRLPAHHPSTSNPSLTAPSPALHPSPSLRSVPLDPTPELDDEPTPLDLAPTRTRTRSRSQPRTSHSRTRSDLSTAALSRSPSTTGSAGRPGAPRRSSSTASHMSTIIARDGYGRGVSVVTSLPPAVLEGILAGKAVEKPAPAYVP